MSLRLPPVSVQASGTPPPSTRRCCLLPRRPLSTGLGPVCEPPFSLARGWSRRSPATTRSPRPRAAQPTAARAAAPRHLLAAKPAAAATPSSRNQTRAPAANAPSRSPCAARTESPATPAGPRTAYDPGSETAAPSSATAAPAAPTTHPRHPTASPASTSLPTLTTDADGLRYRRTGPFIRLELLRLGLQRPKEERMSGLEIKNAQEPDERR